VAEVTDLARILLVCLAIWFSLLALLFATSKARAHDWYPASCCSGKDCEPVPYTAVVEVQGGWNVDFVSLRLGRITQFLPYRLKRESLDGGFHGCWRPDGTPICFFVPVNT
jgi:hypothetical protein